MDDDPSTTRPEADASVTAELRAAGFEDAVELGHGESSVVYRCTQPALDRSVAVKLVLTDSARFLREQRVLGKLAGHPHIVPVFATGVTDDGTPYAVMPYHPRGSLAEWIRRHGPMPVEDVLRIGAKIAGALEFAHGLGVVHRDVKPGNILLTEYDEPALADFGMAYPADGPPAPPGLSTGAPAFTAPEILRGELPAPAGDIYGLGATMFCALTGHAAFERRRGEDPAAQLRRITTEAIPDLGRAGVPVDVSVLVARMMSRDVDERPDAAALRSSIEQTHQGRMSATGGGARQPPQAPRVPERGEVVRLSLVAGGRGSEGNLPLELNTFVDRRTELAEVKSLLATHRLVTLTGVGGVGKTRLAIRAAAKLRGDFADGVWLVELADVTTTQLLREAVAATVGVREAPARGLIEILAEALHSREILLILDSCEQVVQAVAELTESLLQACPDLRVLATSRERLNVAGETVKAIAPLRAPPPDSEVTLREMPRFDGVALFTDRAAAAQPGFELDETNKTDIARICSRLDGLPLAIELAATRVRTMSVAQIVQRLTDRYALLTRGSRTAPTRQQTLRWCVDWSYSLCTPVEQRMWARLAVFTGSFALDAAEEVCGGGIAAGESGASDPLDALSSLVDKSVLVHEDTPAGIRFRMLATIRDYGLEKLRNTGEEAELRRRHRDWFRRLVFRAESEWISDRQLHWQAELERERPNLRAALGCYLSDDASEAAVSGLRIATALGEFWILRGLHGEGRLWLDRALSRGEAAPTADRVAALCVNSQLSAAHGDFDTATTLLHRARDLVEPGLPELGAHIAYTEGVLAFTGGELDRASSAVNRAVRSSGSDPMDSLRIRALIVQGWVAEVRDETTVAVASYREVLDVTEARGEYYYRSAALRGMGVLAWQQGERDRAQQLLRAALRLNRTTHSPPLASFGLEAMAWVASIRSDAQRAAVLLGAAQGLWPAARTVSTVLPNMFRFHDECERTTRRALGEKRFDLALRRGRAMSMNAAIAFALEEEVAGTSASAGARAGLTERERQVADLVAEGLTNRQVAARLVISQRTAQGHVEHILTKLGFTSRAQIAAWVVGSGHRG
jgi:non-specific serine/threonine protein kinase